MEKKFHVDAVVSVRLRPDMVSYYSLIRYNAEKPPRAPFGNSRGLFYVQGFPLHSQYSIRSMAL